MEWPLADLALRRPGDPPTAAAVAATARSTPLWLDLAGWWVAVGTAIATVKAGASCAGRQWLKAQGWRWRRVWAAGAKVAVVESATLGIPGSASAAAGSRGRRGAGGGRPRGWSGSARMVGAGGGNTAMQASVGAEEALSLAA